MASLGVHKADSHRWQLIASLSPAALERYLQHKKDARREITTADIEPLLAKEATERQRAEAQARQGGHAAAQRTRQGGVAAAVPVWIG